MLQDSQPTLWSGHCGQGVRPAKTRRALEDRSHPCGTQLTVLVLSFPPHVPGSLPEPGRKQREVENGNI